MATKPKRRPAPKKTKKAHKAPAKKSVSRTEIEYLQTLILFDERNIDGSGSSLDLLFTKQRERTLAKIEALKARK